MQNKFENSIKNKVEQFDGIPPEKLWTDISQKIKKNTMENKSNNYTRKLWLAVAAVATIILVALFWKTNMAKTEVPVTPQSPIAHRVAAEGSGTTANEMFPTELEKARQQSKGIMAYICMENCKFCNIFVNETLSKPEVHEYLEERFIQVAVDLRDKKNRPFLKEHETNAAPSALFFGPDGTFLTKSKGAIPTEEFMEVAGEAWNAISENSGLYTQNNKIPEGKVFPNPNNGNFNIQVKAADEPVLIKINNENGREVYRQQQDYFSGYYEDKIDLTAFPTGVYYLQIVQGKKIVTEKIIVQ